MSGVFLASRGDPRPEARLSGYWTQRVGRGSVPGVVESGVIEGGVVGLATRSAAPPIGCVPSGGRHLIGSIRPVWGHSTRERRFHLIESIAPDQNGLMIADGVFCLIDNKRRRGVGRPFSCPGSVGDAFRAFIGARPARACAAGPRRRCLSGVYRRLSYPCACSWAPLATPDRHPTGHSRAVLHQRGSMTPGVLAGVLQH